MNERVKYWYTARCSCVKPIIYQERDRYPQRCARCGGHLYSEPRAFHFERLSHTPIVDVRALLRLLGLGVLAVLALLWMAMVFIVFGGQP